MPYSQLHLIQKKAEGEAREQGNKRKPKGKRGKAREKMAPETTRVDDLEPYLTICIISERSTCEIQHQRYGAVSLGLKKESMLACILFG